MPHLLKGIKEKKQSGHIWKVFQVHVNPGQGAVREPILIELVIINQLLIHFKSISKYYKSTRKNRRIAKI